MNLPNFVIYRTETQRKEGLGRSKGSFMEMIVEEEFTLFKNFYGLTMKSILQYFVL